MNNKLVVLIAAPVDAGAVSAMVYVMGEAEHFVPFGPTVRRAIESLRETLSREVPTVDWSVRARRIFTFPRTGAAGCIFAEGQYDPDMPDARRWLEHAENIVRRWVADSPAAARLASL